MSDSTTAEEVRYRVTGMDCPSCARKIESIARHIEDVHDVKVSIASQIMTVHRQRCGATSAARTQRECAWLSTQPTRRQ